jgi:hypothetical protein
VRLPVDGAAGAVNDEGKEEDEVIWLVCEPEGGAEPWLPWVPEVDDLALWRERGRGPGLPGRAEG